MRKTSKTEPEHALMRPGKHLRKLVATSMPPKLGAIRAQRGWGAPQ